MRGQATRADPNGDAMHGALLGPAWGENEIEDRLLALGARFSVIAEENALLESCCDELVEQKAVGWFQGRMEFGPRALGSRSILADARSPIMQRVLNEKIKFRESFRPFAPAVLAEDAPEWFDGSCPSPYMLLVADVSQTHLLAPPGYEQLAGLERLKAPHSTIPAVTHVDNSARLQTVDSNSNPRFRKLLARFKQRTGCPVLVNTSFNVRGEPIVCSPEDAFRCFMGTDLDTLIIGNCILRKAAQTEKANEFYKDSFTLD
jgi:carbamoyltransferase